MEFQSKLWDFLVKICCAKDIFELFYRKITQLRIGYVYTMFEYYVYSLNRRYITLMCLKRPQYVHGQVRTQQSLKSLILTSVNLTAG